MKKLTFILIIAFAFFAVACPKKTKTLDVYKQVVSIKNKTATPQGVSIWIQDGVTYNTFDTNGIEQGLQQLFEKTKCLSSGAMRSFNDYTVAVLKSTEFSQAGFPVYRLPCAQYCGTEYDKGGYITVAGQMLIVNQNGKNYNVIVIPDYNSNTEALARIIEYEGEHLFLFYTNPQRFEETKTHADGQRHPIINDCLQKTSSIYNEVEHLDYKMIIDNQEIDSIVMLAK